MFTKESLETLRGQIDLVEVLEPHIELKRAGAVYKALCPFHQEKSPSFVVQRGDTHYHCFGCGAHGDAIQFLIGHLGYTFVESVEALAEQFHVPLEREERQEEQGVNRLSLKESLETASLFFHDYLIHSEAAADARNYLFKRGISLEFIRRFQVGLAPNSESLFFQVMQSEKIDSQTQLEAGLLSQSSRRPFFRDRITFPVLDTSGRVIGFSARKYRESTYGGKYINTSETSLFKKSRILYGLNYSRRRIAKERQALIVEGQIDCLKLIEGGLDMTVASLGTAFGEGHIAQLKQLGVHKVHLLFDGDPAGRAAASKVGNLFQAAGIEVFVPKLPGGSDPDTVINKSGITSLIELLKNAEPYLPFQVDFLSQEFDLQSPAGKSAMIKQLKKQIEAWEDPVMVHESLRQIARLVQVPEETVGLEQVYASNLFVRKREKGPIETVDPNRVLELDLLRWLILMEAPYLKKAREYLKDEHFWVEDAQKIFRRLITYESMDLLALAAELSDPTIIDEIMQKKVNRKRAETQFAHTIQQLLDRQWMQTREEIKRKIESEACTEEQVLELAKRFNALERPVVAP